MPKVYIALFHIKLPHTHPQNTHTHVINTGAVPIIQVVGEAGARKHFASLGEYVEWRMALEKKSSEGIHSSELMFLGYRYVVMLYLSKRLGCIVLCMLIRRNLDVNARTHTDTYLTVSGCIHTQHTHTHTDGQQWTIFIRGQTCGKMPQSTHNQ
jgi:hypothetical protein